MMNIWLGIRENRASGSSYTSASVDDNYMVVGMHLDQQTQVKIANWEYVDFAKLIPKIKLVSEDNRMELVSKGGYTYFMPVADRETTTINNFNWCKQHSEFFLMCSQKHSLTKLLS